MLCSGSLLTVLFDLTKWPNPSNVTIYPSICAMSMKVTLHMLKTLQPSLCSFEMLHQVMVVQDSMRNLLP